MNRQMASEWADIVRALGPREMHYATAIITKSPTDGRGTFTALVSTFGGEPDTQGDVIAPGAFRDSITNAKVKRAERNGTNLWPVYWNHRYVDPENALGGITAAAETPQGLVVEGKLDLDNPRALAVYEGMLGDYIREYSIGYAIVREHKRADGANVLDEVELLEISVVTAGANRYTRTLAVKGHDPARDELRRYQKAIDDAEHADQKLSVTREAEIDAFIASLRTGTTDGDFEITTAAKSELDAYKRKIDELAAPSRRAKSDAEVRAEINRLYDEHVLPAKLEQLKADEAIFGARVRRREREEKQRAIERTEAVRWSKQL
jgi:uncharacterized protein